MDRYQKYKDKKCKLEVISELVKLYNVFPMFINCLPLHQDAGGGGLETVVAVAEVPHVTRYLLRITSVMLEDDDEPSTELQSAFKNPHNIEMIRKFVTDPQTKSVLIQRCATKGIIFYSLYVFFSKYHLCEYDICIFCCLLLIIVYLANVFFRPLFLYTEETEEGGEVEEEKEVVYLISIGVQFTSIKMNRFVSFIVGL